jgi:rRNA maturation endonuclease Nob1
MFDHFWPRLDVFWHRREKDDNTSHSEHTIVLEHDNEVRCWNCGEYLDPHAEVCPYCGHSPDPVIEDFTKKLDT